MPRDVDPETWRRASQYQRGRLKWIEGPPATDDPDDPTPAEIAAACLAIQAGWAEGEAERRRVQPVESPFAQVVTLGEVLGVD